MDGLDGLEGLQGFEGPEDSASFCETANSERVEATRYRVQISSVKPNSALVLLVAALGDTGQKVEGVEFFR